MVFLGLALWFWKQKKLQMSVSVPLTILLNWIGVPLKLIFINLFFFPANILEARNMIETFPLNCDLLELLPLKAWWAMIFRKKKRRYKEYYHHVYWSYGGIVTLGAHSQILSC